jgi:predicted flap endonuclease-1-like 5' DNA nuclease
MHTVLRTLDATSELDVKLNGLIAKLVALRTEIDATLAELEARAVVGENAGATPDTLAGRLAHLKPARTLAAEEHVPFAHRVEQFSSVHADEDGAGAHEGTISTEVALIATASPAPLTNEVDTQSIDQIEQDTCPETDDGRSDTEAVYSSATEPEAIASEICAEVLEMQPGTVAEAHQPAAEAVVEQHACDDLTRICGIDATTADQLNARGIIAYRQIARLSPDEVTRLSAQLGLDRRISKENWIEQAAILASGESTTFAREPAAMAAAELPAEHNLRPYEHIEEALRADAAARSEETRIISLQEHKLKQAATRSAADSTGVPRRRGRYMLATVATGLAASLGFAAVMLVDVDELRAKAAASETLRNLIHQTKRQFESRPTPAANIDRKADDPVDVDAGAFWLRHMEMYPSGA